MEERRKELAFQVGIFDRKVGKNNATFWRFKLPDGEWYSCFEKLSPEPQRGACYACNIQQKQGKDGNLYLNLVDMERIERLPESAVGKSPMEQRVDNGPAPPESMPTRKAYPGMAPPEPQPAQVPQQTLQPAPQPAQPSEVKEMATLIVNREQSIIRQSSLKAATSIPALIITNEQQVRPQAFSTPEEAAEHYIKIAKRFEAYCLGRE